MVALERNRSVQRATGLYQTGTTYVNPSREIDGGTSMVDNLALEQTS